MMKAGLTGLIRAEKGQALVLAVILLLIGGLIAAPLLAYMGTGLITGEVYEKRTAELYAADAGIEDALWKIQNGEVVLCPGQPHYSYNVSDVNGKKVDVTITLVNNTTNSVTYRIESTASADGSATAVQAYIDGAIVSANYSGILDSVITSQCDYELQGPTVVDPPEGEEHGPTGNYSGDWPTAEILANWFRDDVQGYPYGSSTLDVKNYASGFGPLYRDGTLQIVNTGSAGLTTKLNGTIYVTGDTLIGTTDKAFTLDLNGHTIFVESATGAAPEDDPCNPEDNKYALQLGTKVTLKGSGAIIAVGNIDFLPNLNCSPTDFIFVLSVRGKTYMYPNGDFYGALAGSAEVQIKNGEAYWWPSPYAEGGLNFPYTAVVNEFYDIASWDVKPA
jgi:hypothetical protein